MTTIVIEPPAPFIALALAKQHLRVDQEGEDELIGAYIAAACAHIDGPRGWLGRAIGLQTLEFAGRFSDDEPVTLLCPPVISIISVLYDDADGGEQTLDAESYRLTRRGLVELVSGNVWPTVRAGSDAARVRYVAGYEDDAIPGAIIAATLLMIGDLYSRRETTGADVAAVQMSTTVNALLSPYRAMFA